LICAFKHVDTLGAYSIPSETGLLIPSVGVSHDQSKGGSIMSLRLVCSMETTFRQLRANEMRLLEKLLDHEFPGRDALRAQLSSVTARQIDENGSLELRYDGDSLTDTDFGCPTEGTCTDTDGGRIAVLLHVKNGRIRLLEVVKEDGSAIVRAPTADALSPY
jgi:hypothetical protein